MNVPFEHLKKIIPMGAGYNDVSARGKYKLQRKVGEMVAKAQHAKLRPEYSVFKDTTLILESPKLLHTGDLIFT